MRKFGLSFVAGVHLVRNEAQFPAFSEKPSAASEEELRNEKRSKTKTKVNLERRKSKKMCAPNVQICSVSGNIKIVCPQILSSMRLSETMTKIFIETIIERLLRLTQRRWSPPCCTFPYWSLSKTPEIRKYSNVHVKIYWGCWTSDHRHLCS